MLEGNLEVAEVVAAVVPAKVSRRKKTVVIGGQRKTESKGGIRRKWSARKGERFHVQVRIQGHKPLNAVFGTEAEAITWKLDQELKLKKGVVEVVADRITLREAFDRYIEVVAPANGTTVDYGRKQMFDRLAVHRVLASLRLNQLDENTAITYAVARKADGVTPSTVMSEFVVLAHTMRDLGRHYKWKGFDPFSKDVRKVLKGKKLVAESSKRERTAEESELELLRAHFAQAGLDEPMADIMDVANWNAFRLGEIVRMKWDGLNEVTSQIRVSRKDPSATDGTGRRDCWVPLLPQALAIILRQPRIDGEDRIFPFVGDTVSGRFTDACRAVGINKADTPDADCLCFHDLRHTALSRLAHVPGMTISELKLISGHKSTRHLERYINHNKQKSAALVSAKLKQFFGAVQQQQPALPAEIAA